MTEEERREEEELVAKHREELAELGLPPYDTSKMVEGPPVTPDDVQALFKLIRGGLDLKDILRLEANIEQYRNWYDAMVEVMDIVGREIGEDFRRRN